MMVITLTAGGQGDPPAAYSTGGECENLSTQGAPLAVEPALSKVPGGRPAPCGTELDCSTWLIGKDRSPGSTERGSWDVCAAGDG